MDACMHVCIYIYTQYINGYAHTYKNTHTHTKTHTWIVHICSHRYSRISHETLNVAGDDVASDLKQFIVIPLGTYRISIP